MDRTKERLHRLHVNLSSAAPHLRHELDRVEAKDIHFDVHEYEQTVQEEMERQHELIQRLTQLEEDEWARRLSRTERWVQTDPSRHFKLLKDELADGNRQRYVLGVEMGLMDNQWVSDRQEQMEDEERRAEMAIAARQRRSGISLHSPTNSQLSSSRDRSHSHISPALAAYAASSSPGLHGALPPPANNTRRSSSLAGEGGSGQPGVRSRQRSGSVMQPTLSSTAKLEQSSSHTDKARRSHARTRSQTMLPAGWEHSETNEPSTAPIASSSQHRASITSVTGELQSGHGKTTAALSSTYPMFTSLAGSSKSHTGQS